MPINFGRNRKSKKKTSKIRDLVESVLGSKTVLQVDRIIEELKKSGAIVTASDLNKAILKDYKMFKTYLPRTGYNQSALSEAKKLVGKFDSDFLSAEELYNIVKKIDENVPDSTFYYWFEKINYTFSTKSEYNKEICTVVVFMALCRKQRLSSSSKK
jgi:hypothetical protein